MRLYLAGPMTGIESLNFPAFHAETARLRALGYEVVNPAEINADPTAGWHECMRRDIPELLKCDALAMLPQWQNSRGACVEHTLAIGLDMPVLRAKDIKEGP